MRAFSSLQSRSSCRQSTVSEMELDVGSLSVEELFDVLLKKGLSEEVVKAIETK